MRAAVQSRSLPGGFAGRIGGKAREPVRVLEMFHRQLRAGGFLALDRYQAMPDEAAHLFARVSAEGPFFRKVETTCG
jgi:hypothetical protein